MADIFTTLSQNITQYFGEPISDDFLFGLTKRLISLQENTGKNWLDNHLIKALLRFKLGYPEDSLVDFNNAVNREPNEPLLYFTRATIHANLRNTQLAMNDFSRAISLDPNNPEYWFVRGELHYILAEWSEAIDDFNTAISLNKYYVMAYLNKILVNIILRDKESVLADLSIVKELSFTDEIQTMLEEIILGIEDISTTL